MSSVALGELARGQRSQDATPTCGFTKLHYTQTGFAWRAPLRNWKEPDCRSGEADPFST